MEGNDYDFWRNFTNDIVLLCQFFLQDCHGSSGSCDSSSHPAMNFFTISSQRSFAFSSTAVCLSLASTFAVTSFVSSFWRVSLKTWLVCSCVIVGDCYIHGTCISLDKSGVLDWVELLGYSQSAVVNLQVVVVKEELEA